jgi:hypothetical protein
MPRENYPWFVFKSSNAVEASGTLRIVDGQLAPQTETRASCPNGNRNCGLPEPRIASDDPISQPWERIYECRRASWHRSLRGKDAQTNADGGRQRTFELCAVQARGMS